MDSFDQIQGFERIRKTIQKNVLDWTCLDTLKFLQLTSMTIYEASFLKRQVDGKKMIKSYSNYNYDKFKDKTNVSSLLHYQKFIMWTYALKENYDKYLISVTNHFLSIESNTLKSNNNNNNNNSNNNINNSNKPTNFSISPKAKNQNSNNNMNACNGQLSSSKKNSKTSIFDFIEESARNSNNAMPSLFNSSTNNNQSIMQTSQNSDLFNSQTLSTSSSQRTEINIQNASNRSSKQDISNKQCNQQINGNNTIDNNNNNVIYKKITENFNQCENQIKLMDLLEESKGNKKGLQYKYRISSRCIKTTYRQKNKIIEIIDKLGADKCFLFWNHRLVHSILQTIQFNSLIPLVDLWGLDGFIIQLIIPMYSLRQIETAFECKYEDVEKLFWLSDIFNAIKFTEKLYLFQPQYRGIVKDDLLQLQNNNLPIIIQTYSSNDQNNSNDHILHNQIQNFMNTNNQNFNSSLTLFVPAKKLSIDTLDSSDQSASQNLDKQMNNNENEFKKEKWQHNSSNITQNVNNKTDSNSFMLINSPGQTGGIGSTSGGGRKGSEDITAVPTQKCGQNLQNNQKRKIENSNCNQDQMQVETISDLTPVSSNNNINQFGESIFIPDCLIHDHKVEKKKRISINFNKTTKAQQDSYLVNDSISQQGNEGTIKNQKNNNNDQQEQKEQEQSEFAESTILNNNKQAENETFTVQIDNRAQSQSITYCNPMQLNPTKQSILHTIVEKDQSAESQSLADSLITSNKLSTIPGGSTDRKLYDSGFFANLHAQHTKHPNHITDEFGSSTLLDSQLQNKIINKAEFQESVYLADINQQQLQQIIKQDNNANRNQNKLDSNNKCNKQVKNQDNNDSFSSPILNNNNNNKNNNNIDNQELKLFLQQSNSINYQFQNNDPSASPLPQQMNTLQSQQTASIAHTNSQFQESVILTSQATTIANFNQFAESVQFQPQTTTINNITDNKYSNELQESVILNNNNINQQNQQNYSFQDSVTFPINSNLKNNNNNQYQLQKPTQQSQFQQTFQNNTTPTKTTTTIQNNNNNFKEEELQESVIFDTRLQGNNTQTQSTNQMNKNTENIQQELQESVIMNLPSQNNQQTQQYNESIILKPQSNNIQQKNNDNFNNNNKNDYLKFNNNNNNVSPTKQIEQELESSVIINPIRPKQQFEESVLLQPQTQNFNNNQLGFKKQENQQQQIQQNNEFQESTIINPITQPRGISQFQESTLINPQQQMKENNNTNNNNQFQESSIINPQCLPSQQQQNQQQRVQSQFQESSLLFNPPIPQNNLLKKQHSQSNPKKSSFIIEQNFRQSVVRNNNGEIDFNQSLIFNNQIFYQNSSASKISNNKNIDNNFNESNNTQDETPSPVIKPISEEKLSSQYSSHSSHAGSRQSSSQSQVVVPQLQDYRNTHQVYNPKKYKSYKSDEYIDLMKSLTIKTPQLSFNPFDMTSLKKQNSMKIRIKSPDGSLFIDQTVTIDGATFGRKQENSINFPRENMISSSHAEIFFDSFNFYLRDKGSKQGTFIKMKEIKLEQNMLLQLSVSVEIKIQELDDATGRIVIGLRKNSQTKRYEYIMQENEQIKFGRDKERCDVEIKEQSISSEHAKILYSKKQFTIIDSGSLNGIWLRMSPKGEVSQPFVITPDFSFRIYLINIQVLKLTIPKAISQ